MELRAISLNKFTISPIKILVILFLASSLFRGILAAAVGEYYVFYDELQHLEVAQALAYGQGIAFREAPFKFYEILYYLFIVPVFWIFKDPFAVHTAVMVVNALLMSSAVFPVYLLAKKFLTKQSHIWLLVAYSLLIGEMSYTMKVLQENLNYPLIMWALLAFVHIVLEGRTTIANSCLLGGIAFVLYTCKVMNLIVVVAWALYLIAEIAVQPGERTRNIRTLLLFLAVFYLLYTAYAAVLQGLQPDAVTVTPSMGTLIKLILDREILQQLIYAGIIYVFFTVLATGIFPIPMILGSLGGFEKREKKLAWLVFLYVFVAIGVICVIIFRQENLGDIIIRVHTRYYFYVYIPIILLFLKLHERGRLALKYKVGSAIILIGCALLMTVLPTTLGASAGGDSPSAVIYSLLRGTDQELLLKQAILIAAVILGVYLLMRSTRALYLLAGCVLMVGIFGSIYVIGRGEASSKNGASPMRADAFELHQFFEQRGLDRRQRGQILVVGEGIVSEAHLECYLTYSHRYVLYSTLQKHWETNGEIDFGTLAYFYRGAWYDPEADAPEFIISRQELVLSGYAAVDVDLAMYHLYERTQGSVGVRELVTGVYNDKWVNPPTKIVMAGDLEDTDATVLLTVDGWIFQDGVDVTYTDGCGNTGVVHIPFVLYSDPDVFVEIPVQKQAGASAYEVTLVPAQSGQAPPDTRELSFRLHGVELRE